MDPHTLRTLRSASSSASETASEGLSGHLTWCLARTLFLSPPDTAFWHPQSLVSLRSACHLTWRPGRTLFLRPSETAFWHPQTLVRLRSVSSSASETASGGLSGHLAALYFYDRPKLLNLLCTRLLVPSHLLALPPRCAFCFAGDYFACQLCCAHGHPAAVLCSTRIRPELCEDNTVVWHSGHLCRYCRAPPQTMPSFTWNCLPQALR